VVPAGNLSPILANVLLNECDRELTRRGGHRFVRYADDMVGACSSKKGAERTLKSTTSYLENVLKLIVNPEKACICRIEGIRFLEYGFFSGSKNK